MWTYDKKLQYPVNIKNPNPALAKLIITQFGGPDGELGAAMRYLSQRYSMPYNEAIGILTDVGIEENYCAQNKKRHDCAVGFPLEPPSGSSLAKNQATKTKFL